MNEGYYRNNLAIVWRVGRSSVTSVCRAVGCGNKQEYMLFICP
jgi:hypothetical protein